VDHLSPHSSGLTLELPENGLSHRAESLLSPKSATAKRKARTVASPFATFGRSGIEQQQEGFNGIAMLSQSDSIF